MSRRLLGYLASVVSACAPMALAQTPPYSSPTTQASFTTTTFLNWKMLQSAQARASCTIYNLSPTDTIYIYFGPTAPGTGSSVPLIGIPISPNGGYYDCHHQAVENSTIWIASGATNNAPGVWTYQ